MVYFYLGVDIYRLSYAARGCFYATIPTAVRGETRKNHAACRSTSQPLQANSTVRGIGCLPLA